ncbi:uncharacterized protein LOC142556894 [Primulina tabacum]|uniref:uncharacterized protein LOC142556894 n=1 Tax=Primulina tabacum TaxID=48773 RepID=UPI003F5AA7CE
MDRVFSKHVGRNVEAYVDNIMVKSKDLTQLIPDLVETFSTLGSYGLKLNPQKCIFRMRGGKFLGYLVTETGIEANPEKVQAIQDMISPRGPNDVQNLTGRIAAVARFISRSAHRSLPFFPTLRKAKKFEWGPDCEKYFVKLKKYLAELHVLAKSIAGEPLWVYLSATEGAENEDLCKVYVDGSSSKDGSGVGVVLIFPAGEKEKLAVRLDFRAFNNEAEYKTVLDGLREARNVGGTRVLVSSDSQMVAQQMKGIYDLKDENLIDYAQEIDIVREKFTEVMFEQIPRKENEKADTLTKMDGTMGSWKTRDVIFQVKLTPHTSSPTVEHEEKDWKTVITRQLKEGKLPDDLREARKLKIKCSRYIIIREVLYQRSFAGPLLRCLSYQEADYEL